MTKTTNSQVKCTPGSFTRGLKIWYRSVMLPNLGIAAGDVAVICAVALTAAIIVHIFFPLGLILLRLFSPESTANMSLLAFDNSVEQLLPIASIGALPIGALVVLVSWVRNLCTMGTPHP